MIYAKKINSAQRTALQKYEQITGFEPIHQDELDDGTMTFCEVWRANQRWFESLAAEVQNISTKGCFK